MTLEKTLSNLRKTKLKYFNTDLDVVRIEWDWFIKDGNFIYDENKFKNFIRRKGIIVSTIQHNFEQKYIVSFDENKNLKWILL